MTGVLLLRDGRVLWTDLDGSTTANLVEFVQLQESQLLRSQMTSYISSLTSTLSLSSSGSGGAGAGGAVAGGAGTGRRASSDGRRPGSGADATINIEVRVSHCSSHCSFFCPNPNHL